MCGGFLSESFIVPKLETLGLHSLERERRKVKLSDEDNIESRNVLGRIRIGPYGQMLRSTRLRLCDRTRSTLPPSIFYSSSSSSVALLEYAARKCSVTPMFHVFLASKYLTEHYTFSRPT